MMNQSVGMKLKVNPVNEHVPKGREAGDMNGYTLKRYWDQHDGVILYYNNVNKGSYDYIAKDLHIKEKKSNPKFLNRFLNYWLIEF